MYSGSNSINLLIAMTSSADICVLVVDHPIVRTGLTTMFNSEPGLEFISEAKKR